MHELNRAFSLLLVALAGVAAAIFAAIAVLVPLNVLLRNAFDTTLYGLLDAVEYGLLAATFLAAPWVLSKNAHVSVDLVVAALPPAATRIVTAISYTIGALVSAVFLWFAVEALLPSIARGTMIRTAFTIPEWWVLSIAPVGMALIVVEFLRKLVREGLGGSTARETNPAGL